MNGHSNGKKRNINPDPAKQAQELIFSRNLQMINHVFLFFNQNIVVQASFQKNSEMFLESKLNFSEHLKIILQKTNKTIGPLRELQTLPSKQQFINPLLGAI